MPKQYTYEEFLDIIKTLRSDDGCPWDREQTHVSLRACMMEEAAEVLAAIRIYDKTGDAENLKEELGDVFLQVVMHAQIASEEGLFTIQDVVNEVAAKMVRRHPHVFGTAVAEDTGTVLQNWEEIKQQEKKGREGISTPLREIPLELPALTRAAKVLKKADKHYGIAGSYTEDVNKLQEAISHLQQLKPTEYGEEIKEQIGNILMAVSDISRLYKISPEQVLTDRIEDLIEECDEKP